MDKTKLMIITCFACKLLTTTSGFPQNKAYNQGPFNGGLFGIGIQPSFGESSSGTVRPRSYNSYNRPRSYNNFKPYFNALSPENEYTTETQTTTSYGKYIRLEQNSNEVQKNYFNINTPSSGYIFKVNPHFQSPVYFGTYNPKINNQKVSTESTITFYTEPTSTRSPITSIKDNETNNKHEQVTEIDKDLIDAIFKDTDYIRDSTSTEGTTTDYTTVTGDYDLTTIDDLLRIPSNVVASLLG